MDYHRLLQLCILIVTIFSFAASLVYYTYSYYFAPKMWTSSTLILAMAVLLVYFLMVEANLRSNSNKFY